MTLRNYVEENNQQNQIYPDLNVSSPAPPRYNRYSLPSFRNGQATGVPLRTAWKLVESVDVKPILDSSPALAVLRIAKDLCGTLSDQFNRLF